MFLFGGLLVTLCVVGCGNTRYAAGGLSSLPSASFALYILRYEASSATFAGSSSPMLPVDPPLVKDAIVFTREDLRPSLEAVDHTLLL